MTRGLAAASRRMPAWLWALPLLAAAFIFARSQSDDVVEVSVAQAKALIDAGALVIDVRGEGAHAQKHLPGAIALPLSKLKEGIPASIAGDKAREVVVYCNDGVRSGPQGTALLAQAGFTRAVNVKGGIEGWMQAGHAVQN